MRLRQLTVSAYNQASCAGWKIYWQMFINVVYYETEYPPAVSIQLLKESNKLIYQKPHFT